MIKKLDIYLIKHFTQKLFFSLLCFIVLFSLVSVIEHLDKFIDSSMPSKEIFLYELYSLPWFISIALPMSVLISTVFTFSLLQKNHELTALKSSGVGIKRISFPLLLIGVLLSTFSFQFENNLVTHYFQKKVDLEEKYNLKRSSRKKVKKNDIYRQIGKNKILTIKKFKYNSNVALNVSIQYFDKNTIIERFDSPKLKWHDEEKLWHVDDHQIRRFANDSTYYSNITKDTLIDINLTPFDLAQETLKPEEMNYTQLKRFINKMYSNGIYEARWVVDYHFKLAFACTNFLMILFGLSLSVKNPRTSMASGLALSIAVIFLYYTFLKIGQSLGYNGILSPFLSIWITNIGFFIFGLYLFIKTKT